MALELPKFAKKEKKEGNVSKNDIVLKIMDFFDKNPLMKILIPVLLFVIVAAIILFVIFGDGVLQDSNPTDGELNANSDLVQVLPDDDILNDKELVNMINDDPLSPDILASAKYKGRVKGSNGRVNALIEIGADGQSIQVERGETIGDSSWQLIEVTADYVIFKAGNEQMKISRK